MRHILAYLAVLAGLGGMVYVTGMVRAQAQTTGAPAAAPTRSGGKVAVFNVVKVMKEYKKWQHFAGLMNQKRVGAQSALGKMRAELVDMQNKIADPKTPRTEAEQLVKIAKDKQRIAEDKENEIKKALDEESTAYLRELYKEIQDCVQLVAETNDFSLVMAYPEALTAEDMASPMYFDMKLRPQFAMPFYVAPNADMTGVLIATLNKKYPAPVEQTGAVTPIPSAPTHPTPGTPTGQQR